MNRKRIDCRKCRHFRVSWDPSKPYGCESFGFKSQMIPSAVVLKTDGVPCRAFSPRVPEGPQSPQFKVQKPSGPPQPGTILRLPKRKKK